MLIAAPVWAAPLWSPAATAEAATLQQQRQMFQDARQTLKADDQQAYAELRSRLQGYPLAPYLDIWQAWRQVGDGNDALVGEVLAQHGDIPESIDLRIAWIEQLAERGQWPHVREELQRLPGAERRLPEIYILALWYSGEQENAYRQFTEYWQEGGRIGSRMHRFHQEWKRSSTITRDALWQRIGHFARRGNWSEVDQLAAMLTRGERRLVAKWRAIRENPVKGLQRLPDGIGRTPAGRMMIDDGLRRLAGSDAAVAWELLGRLESKLEPQQFRKLRQQVALRAAKQHMPAAAAWLEGLPPEAQNDETRAWTARLRLLAGNWQGVLAAIAAMPVTQQEDSCWLYWRARALESLGEKDAAVPVYTAVASGRGYYSFLSAERLALPYRLESEFAKVGKREINELLQQPAMQRAREWWYLDEPGKAGREWSAALRDADVRQWEAATIIADSWGWHDRAIHAAQRAGRFDALAYRFPLGHQAAVLHAAGESGLEPSLIWGVIRQESAFNPRAVSAAGATGLMQLLPQTAEQVARRHRVANGNPDLFDAETNIELGSRYLARLKKRFDGNAAVAVAAYNAGSTRVSRWLQRTALQEADIWIEAIPYDETRRYVQQVMAFAVVYDWRQEKTPVQVVHRIGLAAGEQG